MKLRLLFKRSSKYYKFYLINIEFPQHKILKIWLLKKHSSSMNILVEDFKKCFPELKVELFVTFAFKRSNNAKLLCNLLTEKEILI